MITIIIIIYIIKHYNNQLAAKCGRLFALPFILLTKLIAIQGG